MFHESSGGEFPKEKKDEVSGGESRRRESETRTSISTEDSKKKGQKRGVTFVLTFSNDGGLTREKQMRKTSVCGYDRGRNRS